MSQNMIPPADEQKVVYDVFLSYSHEDANLYGNDLIESIKEEIQNEIQDITCRRLVFLDTEALKYGDEWHAKIMEKIQECRIFICLLSENYLKSSYCTRERLWWEMAEIRHGRLRQDTLPVYFIRLDCDPFKDDRRQVRDLFGFELETIPEPWFPKGKEMVKELYVKERINDLKNAVKDKLSRARIAATGFNNVFPSPSSNFVGRIMELKDLREICACNQFPIIEGKAGVGKSELATVYAYGYASEYPQGCFFLHMEGKSFWEDAVLSLIHNPDTDPKTGTNAKMELGISDKDMKLDARSLHRLIIERLFARARNGRLLLVLDNVDDASLFTERNLLDFSQKRPIPENIHIVATTRHKFMFPKRSRAKAYPLSYLEDDASFELFCEIGENRFPFSRRPILDKMDDAEYLAAMEIIHLLKGHAWSMEIVARQISDKYDKGCTFQKRLSLLQNDFTITKDKGKGKKWSYRNPAEMPAELIRPTLDILKCTENGGAVIQLLYLAALLAPTGEKKKALRAYWDMFCSNITFEDKEVDAFLCAYDSIGSYNLFHSKSDDKMHRLTQTALKQIMKEDGVFDDCLERLADVMAGTLSVSNKIWIDAIAATPNLAECLIRKHPAFFFALVSLKNWVELLTANPSNDILIQMCPWDSLNGDNWVNLLCKQPKFVDKCKWYKLNERNWADLLVDMMQPDIFLQAIGHFPWDRMARKVILSLGGMFFPSYRPQSGHNSIADAIKLSGHVWAFFLCERPQYADHCPWDNMDGFDWAFLLRVQPRFAGRCSWEKLDGEDWADLLCGQPLFASKCPWDRLVGTNWIKLLSEQPQFADKCPWDDIKKTQAWCIQARKKDDCFDSNSMGKDWVWLLCKQPRFANQCPWEKLDGNNWTELLREQPDFEDRCPWKKLNGDNWTELLREQPQFVDKCPWDKLDGRRMAAILCKQPQLADSCPLERLDRENWGLVLLYQPQLANKCPWGNPNGGYRHLSPCLHRQTLDQKTKEKSYEENWIFILRSHPQLVGQCPWDKLTGKEWTELLREHPQFADKCLWNKLTGKEWTELLSEQPQFADKCPWDRLTGKNWTELLHSYPQFAGKCRWDKLDIEDWIELLSEQPVFGDRCPWDELTGYNWVKLLCEQPVFGDRCPWDELTGYN